MLRNAKAGTFRTLAMRSLSAQVARRAVRELLDGASGTDGLAIARQLSHSLAGTSTAVAASDAALLRLLSQPRLFSSLASRAGLAGSAASSSSAAAVARQAVHKLQQVCGPVGVGAGVVQCAVTA